MTMALKRFARNQDGATAIEYGLIAAMVAVALIATLVVFGNNFEGMLGRGAGGAASTIGAAANSL